jgi:hypothetical protein
MAQTGEILKRQRGLKARLAKLARLAEASDGSDLSWFHAQADPVHRDQRLW